MEIDPAHMREMWDGNQSEKIIAYCFQDIDALQFIAEKFDFLATLQQFKALYCMPNLQSTNLRSSSSGGEAYMKKKLPSEFVMSDNTSKSARYSGATVFTPPSGLFKNVFCLDFASLYPSMIIQNNLGPWSSDLAYVDRRIRELPDFKRASEKEITELVSDCFAPSPLDPMAESLRELLSLRKVAKANRKNASSPQEYSFWHIKQNVLKTAANSLYGLAGSDTFYYKSTDTANATTDTGKIMLRKLTHFLEVDKQFTVLYADTDSNYYTLPIDEPLDESHNCTGAKCPSLNCPYQVTAEFNDKYGTAIVKVALEDEETAWGCYPQVLFFPSEKNLEEGLKKMYVLQCRNKDGTLKLKTKGLPKRDSVHPRKDQSIFSKNLRLDLVEIMLSEKNTQQKANEMSAVLIQASQSLIHPKGFTDLLSQFTMRVRVNKVEGNHLTAQLASRLKLKPGTLIQYVYSLNPRRVNLKSHKHLMSNQFKTSEIARLIHTVPQLTEVAPNEKLLIDWESYITPSLKLARSLFFAMKIPPTFWLSLLLKIYEFAPRVIKTDPIPALTILKKYPRQDTPSHVSLLNYLIRKNTSMVFCDLEGPCIHLCYQVFLPSQSKLAKKISNCLPLEDLKTLKSSLLATDYPQICTLYQHIPGKMKIVHVMCSTSPRILPEKLQTLKNLEPQLSPICQIKNFDDSPIICFSLDNLCMGLSLSPPEVISLLEIHPMFDNFIVHIYD